MAQLLELSAAMYIVKQNHSMPKKFIDIGNYAKFFCVLLIEMFVHSQYMYYFTESRMFYCQSDLFIT